MKTPSWDSQPVQTDDNPVVVGRYPNHMGAALAQSVLASHGIEAFIVGDQTARNLGTFVGGMGPVDVEVQVSAAQAAEAIEILETRADEEIGELPLDIPREGRMWMIGRCANENF